MSTTALSSHRLRPTRRLREEVESGTISREKFERFERFLQRIEEEFLLHSIVVCNHYTRWFSAGEGTIEELRHFARQFSVFSNQFLVAQLKKMINAPSLQEMRSAKEILANEIGVIFRDGKRAEESRPADTDREGDPALVGTSGSVDGGTFRFRAAHFEWLVDFVKPLGMGFGDIGKRRHGTRDTLHFCDALIRIYGNENSNVSAGAGFAIENWAAAGFWQEIEDGLSRIKRERIPDLKLAFFSWHNRLEAQHAAHTMEELESLFFGAGVEEEEFLAAGREMLDALAVFWNGLERDRHCRRVELTSLRP